MMQLPHNTFKAGLRRTTPQIGVWNALASPYAAEIVASTAYDWMLIDGEHAPNSVSDILAQLQAVAAYATAPVVRAPHGDAALIKQLLDIGAQSLMIPMVDSAAQAQDLVRAMRYPPHGMRGMGGGLTRAARWNAIPDYVHAAQQELCLIVQIESRQGVDNAAAIAAVDGVDAVFIGPLDLSASLGYVGNPMHPEVQNRIQHVIQTTVAAGKACGILSVGNDDAGRYLEWGCQFIAVALDVQLLRQSALATLARYRPDEKKLPVPSRAY